MPSLLHEKAEARSERGTSLPVWQADLSPQDRGLRRLCSKSSSLVAGDAQQERVLSFVASPRTRRRRSSSDSRDVELLNVCVQAELTKRIWYVYYGYLMQNGLLLRNRWHL